MFLEVAIYYIRSLRVDGTAFASLGNISLIVFAPIGDSIFLVILALARQWLFGGRFAFLKGDQMSKGAVGPRNITFHCSPQKRNHQS